MVPSLPQSVRLGESNNVYGSLEREESSEYQGLERGGEFPLVKCFEKLRMGRMINIHHFCLNVFKVKLELRGNEKTSYTTITT